MVCVSALCACFYAPHHVRVVLTTLGDVQRRLALLPGSDVDSLASMGSEHYRELEGERLYVYRLPLALSTPPSRAPHATFT